MLTPALLLSQKSLKRITLRAPMLILYSSLQSAQAVLPQQQQWQNTPPPPQQQQQQQIVRHYNNVLPRMPTTWQGYHHIPQFPPWMANDNMPVAPLFCCSRYQEWHNRPSRMGWPPHDRHCHKRRIEGKKKELTDKQACGALI